MSREVYSLSEAEELQADEQMKCADRQMKCAVHISALTNEYG